MVVGVARVHLHVPEAQSLKHRRSVLNQVKANLRNHVNVSVAEIEPDERWQRTTLGLSAVSGDRNGAARLMQQAIQWIRQSPRVVIIDIEEEYL